MSKPKSDAMNGDKKLRFNKEDIKNTIKKIEYAHTSYNKR